MSEKRTRSLSQSTTAELNHNKAPECLVHNQTFCGSIYSKKNLLHVTKFCYEKSLTKVCYERTLLQNCRLKHSHKERKCFLMYSRFCSPYLKKL